MTDPLLTLLLLCCRQTLGPAQIAAITGWIEANPPLSNFDWPLFYRLAHNHGVAPLIYQNIQRIDELVSTMPAAVNAAFQHATYRAIAVKAGIRKKLGAIVRFCAARGLRVMVIKGAALDLTVYDKPWYVDHDVDLIFDQPRHTLAPHQVDAIDRYFWDLPGFEYEFYTHHDLTMNGTFAVDFAAIWRDAYPIDVEGVDLWLMAPTDMVLAAAINACRKRYFRLKSLLGLATLLDAHPTLDWALLFAKARRYRCGAVLYAALISTHATIGCTLLTESMPTESKFTLATALHLSSTRQWLIDHLIDRYAASTLLLGAAPFSPTERQWHRSLLLPYSTYSLPQLGRRLRHQIGTTV